MSLLGVEVSARNPRPRRDTDLPRVHSRATQTARSNIRRTDGQYCGYVIA